MKNFEFKKRVDSIDYTLLILNENLIVNANSNLKSWEMKISKEEKQNLLQFNNNWENLKILIQKMFEVKKKKEKERIIKIIKREKLNLVFQVTLMNKC